jgi:hypothetical protein
MGATDFAEQLLKPTEKRPVSPSIDFPFNNLFVPLRILESGDQSTTQGNGI